LKLTDMQASVGCAQMKKLPRFIQSRKHNHKKILDGLKNVKNFSLPKKQANSDPSWFGFLMRINDDSDLERNDVIKKIEGKKIQTRLLFSGNIIRHPVFVENDYKYRVIGNLQNTDKVMNKAFWVGVYPKLKDEELSYMIKIISEIDNA